MITLFGREQQRRGAPDRSRRAIYLQDVLGFSLDPFGPPTAEDELQASRYSIERPPTHATDDLLSPSFFSYFIEPSTSLPEEQALLPTLRRAESQFIFAGDGEGKTTLRYVLETHCRTVRNETFVTSYDLSGVQDIPSPGERQKRMVQAVAVDLLIHVVETFNPINPPPSREQIEALGDLIQTVGGPVKRLARRILDNEHEDTPVLGIAALWSAVKRTSVRSVARTEPLLNLIHSVFETNLQRNEVDSGGYSLVDVWNIARLWGFERLFILVDGVGSQERTEEQMLMFIQYLLEAQGRLEDENIYIKWFLPRTLRRSLQLAAGESREKLRWTDNSEIIVEWDSSSLRRLLRQRFRAGGSRLISIDELAGPGLEGQLEELILESAQWSPRTLLRTVSDLIDHHVSLYPPDRPIPRLISREAWRRVDDLRWLKSRLENHNA